MPLVLLAIPAELFLAVGILLMLWATIWIFQKPLAKLLSLIPVIGGQAAGAVVEASKWMVGVAESWAKVAIDPVVQLWNVGVNALGGFVGQAASTIEAVWNNLNKAAQALWAFVTHLEDVVGAARRTLATTVSKLAATATTLAATVSKVAYLVGTTLPALEARVKSWAAARVSSAVNAAVTTLTAADRAIRALVGQAIDTMAVRLGQAIDGVKAWTGQAIGAALSPVIRAIDAVRADLGALGRSIDGRLGELWKVLTPILALNVPLVLPRVIAELTTLTQECIAPTCNAIKPRLDLLNLLSEGAMLVAMLELVREAVDDPEGAAHAMAAGAGELRELTADLTGPILGIRA